MVQSCCELAIKKIASLIEILDMTEEALSALNLSHCIICLQLLEELYSRFTVTFIIVEY